MRSLADLAEEAESRSIELSEEADGEQEAADTYRDEARALVESAVRPISPNDADRLLAALSTGFR